jgi:hypothetical protein
MSKLATRFARHSPYVLSDVPLTDWQIAAVAPSIFADSAHDSRSERYAYIATKIVLDKLRSEGFQPFMAGQTRVRIEGRREFTKHILRLRHADQISRGGEANEIILVNSHDGTSSYQMLAGMIRFVCLNGLVCGENIEEVRVPHKGDVAQRVVAGAYDVLQRFTLAGQSRDAMRAVTLDQGEQTVLARAALALKYEPGTAPITEAQILAPRRFEDAKSDLWTVFNRLQENLVQGGIQGRATTGRRLTTRPVTGIDQGVGLNRALWTLAEGMQQLKG